MLGVYNNETRGRQLLKFDNMVFNGKCLTDFDAVMEYDNRAWIVFEAKHGNKEVPCGQRLALERFVRDIKGTGKHAIAAVVEHEVSDPHIDVFLGDCKVRQIYTSNELSWRLPKIPMTAQDMTRRYIDYIEGIR